MTTKLQKWGNSLGVRIPKEILKKAKFKDGKLVTIKNIGDSVVISPSTKQETLNDLLSQITPENIHAEIDWGEPVGNEIW